MLTYSASIRRVAVGYQIAILTSDDDPAAWVVAQLPDTYWALTQRGANARANRIKHRRRLADDRETAAELVYDNEAEVPT